MSASDLLMEIMVGQGIPEEKAQMIAERIMATGVIDRWSVVRLQIMADPETDWKIVKRRYQCSRGLVYKVWNERLSMRVNTG